MSGPLPSANERKIVSKSRENNWKIDIFVEDEK